MKKLLFILLCLPFIGFGQSLPQGINYQAVARDANGDVLMNQALTIQFSVISDITTARLIQHYKSPKYQINQLC